MKISIAVGGKSHFAPAELRGVEAQLVERRLHGNREEIMRGLQHFEGVALDETSRVDDKLRQLKAPSESARAPCPRVAWAMKAVRA